MFYLIRGVLYDFFFFFFCQTQDWSLPAEAFQLRHELQFGMAPPVPMTHDSPASANDSDVNSFNTTVNNNNNNKDSSCSSGVTGNDLYISVKLPIMPPWDCRAMVKDMLISYVEQVCVCC